MSLKKAKEKKLITA